MWKDNVHEKDLKTLLVYQVIVRFLQIQVYALTIACCGQNVRDSTSLVIWKSFDIFSETIKVKIIENGNLISITHTQNFIKYFPEVDLLPNS